MHGAAQGFAPAQYNMGLCYEEGSGVDKNFEEALRLYRLAASNDLPDAINYLGELYEAGTEVPIDLPFAVSCYKRAVVLEYGRAFFNLGRCYENGIAVEKSACKACELYKSGMENGDLKAKSNYLNLTQIMDERWQRRRMALWLIADTPKKMATPLPGYSDNLFYQLPTDVAKISISYL